MAKRDYIAEILTKKARLYPKTKRWEKVAPHLRSLGDALEVWDLIRLERGFLEDKIYERDGMHLIIDILGGLYELKGYFAVRCVACMEGYFRLAIADLIDFGEPFRSNAANFNQINFSIDTALSLQKNSVTIGEFIAHLVSVNNLQDIISNMNKILNLEFMGLFKNMSSQLQTQKWFFEEDFDTVSGLLATINSIFKSRHIICHEIAEPEDEFNPRNYYEQTTEFLWITENIINDLTT